MPRYDLIMHGGTVLDPANGFEDVSDVGIVDGRIDRVEPELDQADADDVIDVAGKWVMPGQIDTHAHVAGLARNWDPALGHAMLARAGTTTVLDMGGTGPGLIDGIQRKGAGLNVAGLFAMIPGRSIPEGEPKRAELADIVSNALRQGCIGIKMLGGYYPFAPGTTADIIAACNDQTAYVAYHVGSRESGSHLGGLREVPDIVGKGRLHVCHVNSYCRGVIDDPNAECDEALAILESKHGQLSSEAYHAVPNGTNGRCDSDGNVLADVPRNCLRLRGYPTTREGVRQAILDGYASVVAQRGGRVMYVKGQDALKLFEDADTNVGMSYPVNLPTSAFRLATAKDDSGEFMVDAVSTDGGSHPRNVAVQSTMALVQFGALTPLEMATKLSWMPARMLGLGNKGHFSTGADADITVLDPAANQPVMSLVAGKLIMLDGRSIGSGGTLLVTRDGEQAAKDSGLPYQVLDLAQSKLYAGFSG
jgi:hypothetical protein